MNEKLAIVFVCILVLLAGCNQAQTNNTISKNQTSSTPIITDSTTKTSDEFDGATTISTTTVTTGDSEGSHGKHLNFTGEFEKMVKNGSLDINKLNVSYNGTEFNDVAVNITNIKIRNSPIDDQKTLVVSHNIDNVTSRKLRERIGKIGMVFATVLKKESVLNDDNWNVSQLRILTYTDGKLAVKNRVTLSWANGWSYGVLDWTTKGYVDRRILATSDIYNPKTGEFNKEMAETLETRLEIARVGTNITAVHVNQSDSVLFLTYVTTTPPSENYMADHVSEYMKIITEYGALHDSKEFDKYNFTTLYIEEVYKSGPNQFDTRRIYRVRSPFALKVAHGKVGRTELARHLLNRVFQEDDGYDE